VFESGRPIAQVARDLGVHREALRHWVRQAEADGQARDRLPTQERERRGELEREVRELRRLGSQRRRRKNSRTSPMRRSGASRAAKWPPRSKSDQWTMLLLCSA
jgi:transposase-like protein